MAETNPSENQLTELEYQHCAAPHDRRLFETGLFSDLKIICESKVWGLHQNILASRCQWFEKALCGNLKEAHPREIVMEETNPRILDWVLEYIYCGVLNLDCLGKETSFIEACMDGYDVADFFLLPDLRDKVVKQFNEYNDKKCGSLQNEVYTKNINPTLLGEILHDLEAAYSRDPPSGGVFQDLMSEFFHTARYRLLRYSEFINTLDEIPRLAADVLCGMIRSGEFMPLRYPNRCCECKVHKSAGEHHTHINISSDAQIFALCSHCVSMHAAGSSRDDWALRWQNWRTKEPTDVEKLQDVRSRLRSTWAIIANKFPIS